MHKQIAFLVVALAAVTGCSGTMHGSAPAKDGGNYVAGSKVEFFIGEQPQIYHCPPKGPCTPVTVTLEEK